VLKKAFFLFWVLLACLSGPAVGTSLADELNGGLSRELSESRNAVLQALIKLRGGNPATRELAQLKGTAEAIRASHLLMQERFAANRIKTDALGGKATARLEAVAAPYQKALDDYLALIDAFPADGSVTPESLESVKALLDTISSPRKRPLLGALPYKHLNYPAREPFDGPAVIPAYQGGNRSITPADTAATPEAPLSKEIVDQAKALSWNPVLIYEWVKNNVETEWYWGSMKGAEETLRQKSGNDADQAALLTSLLRASGFPTRYVRGSIEFFPDLNKLKNLVGLDDPVQIATFFQKAGIPFKPVLAAGGISNFRVEHIWVETFIPYANYRGAVVDDQGKNWLAIDTSIKPQGYTRSVGADLPDGFIAGISDDYLAGPQQLTPLEYIQKKIADSPEFAASGKTYQDFLSTKALIPGVLKIIPSSLQFVQSSVTGEYTAIPDELRHTVTFSASSSDSNLFSITLDTAKLSNRKLVMSYEPETVEDQQIVDSFGGIANTPAYLVQLRPVLMLEDERLVVGRDGLPMGGDYRLDLDISTPNGSERVSSNQIAGNMVAFGVVAQKAVSLGALKEDDEAATILFKEAISYVDRWTQAEDALSVLLKQSISRPAVSAVSVGGQVDVVWLIGSPQEISWKGVFIDAGFRRIESVGRNGGERDFIQGSGLQGSVLENRIFEDDFQVDSVSTAKLLQLARANGNAIVTIDRNNIDSVLPTLTFSNEVKGDIIDAVNQNLRVTVPSGDIVYQDWTGTGYLKENPETGESGWMLSGQVAGGMTAARAWVNAYLSETLGNPYAKPNKDKLSAARIMKIPVTDQQKGTVGKEVKEKLAVFVTDKGGKPVEKAVVTFRVIAGGGSIKGNLTVTTSRLGIASVDYALGKITSDNAIYIKLNPTDEQLTQVGLNLVTASVDTHGDTISLLQAFESYGVPGAPATIVKGFGDGASNLANNPAGSLQVKVVDSYGNPASNVTMLYQAGGAISKDPAFTLPPSARNIKFYLPQKGTDVYPLYGELPTLFAATQKTSSEGCFVNTILGNTVNTQYTVMVTSVSHPQLAPVSFSLASEGHRQDGEYLPPALLIRYLDSYNSSGQRVNSTRVGTALKNPLTSDLFMQTDEYNMTGPKTCLRKVSALEIPYECWQIVPTGLTKVTRMPKGAVTYKVTAGSGKVGTSIMAGGRYQATFTAGALPESNTIMATGSATVTVPEVLLDPDTGKAILDGYTAAPLTQREISMQSSKQVLFNKETKVPVFGDTEKLTDYLVYSVDVKLSFKPSVISINKDGYAKRDTVLTYTILPAEYNGLISAIDFFAKDEAGGETWKGALPGDKTQGQGSSITLAGTWWDVKKQFLAQVVLNNGSDIEIRGGRTPVPLALGALIPDYNHDRKIDDSDRLRAELGDPFYFWVNDNYDFGDVGGDGIPGSDTPDGGSFGVNGTRDLIDLFPVYLDLKDLLNVWGPNYKYVLRQTGGFTTDINLVETDLEPANSGRYLAPIGNGATEPFITLSNAKKYPVGSEGYVLSPDMLNRIVNGKGVVLLEGVHPSQNPLLLEVHKGSTTVYSMSLNLSIDGVEQMFRHKNLIQAIGASNAPLMESGSIGEHHAKGGEMDRIKVSHFANLKHFSGFDASCDNKYVVMLHGANVNGQDARGWHAELFKRLYWAGSKAHFVGISWYSNEGMGWEYYPKVVHAFDTAAVLGPALGEVAGISAPVTLIAHSLGNMVVSSYLADHYKLQSPTNRPNVVSYLMLNSAVAIEAFLGDYEQYAENKLDETFGSEHDNNHMFHSDWVGYRKIFAASEWHQLFGTDDGRRYLTWRNRFAVLPSGIKYISYYSKGEDVLASYAGTQPSPVEIADFNLGANSWVLQEKWKGRPLGLGGAGYMGWGFNLLDPKYNPYLQGHLGAAEANLLLTDNEQLIPTPFFLNVATPGVADVLFSELLVEPAEIKLDYNKLMASAIPALTTATGGWAGGDLNNRFSVFDMNQLKNDDLWPRDNKKWTHSDVKNVAFPFVYGVLDDLVKKGAL
jgi:transglutaminase-like putative cysteine protease/pimeloyl-ACP methyl ester carboxylesterase